MLLYPSTQIIRHPNVQRTVPPAGEHIDVVHQPLPTVLSATTGPDSPASHSCCGVWVPGLASLARDDILQFRPSLVVPAKAGTHTPQHLSSIAEYGSRVSP